MKVTAVNKDFRQKIEDRDDFTYDERKRISMKSDDRCCHCGKLCYFGFGATVDHFIPISRGGTNDPKNLVMMCYDCNEAKGNLIVAPVGYLPYIKDKYMEEVIDYFEEYIDSFEFIERTNMLACDEYVINFYPQVCEKFLNKKKHSRKYGGNDTVAKRMSVQHTFKHAQVEDAPKLEEYLTNYLIKRDCLGSREAVKYNIEFWLKYGCIYYLENSDGVRYMTCLTYRKNMIRKNGEYEKDEDICIYMFPSSASALQEALSDTMIDEIVKNICYEQRLYMLPLYINFVNTEPLARNFLYNKYGQYYENGDYISVNISDWSMGRTMYKMIKKKDDYREVVGDHENTVLKDDAMRALDRFFGKFKDITHEVKVWCKKHPDADFMEDLIYQMIDLDSVPEKDAGD